MSFFSIRITNYIEITNGTKIYDLQIFKRRSNCYSILVVGWKNKVIQIFKKNK